MFGRFEPIQFRHTDIVERAVLAAFSALHARGMSTPDILPHFFHQNRDPRFQFVRKCDLNPTANFPIIQISEGNICHEHILKTECLQSQLEYILRPLLWPSSLILYWDDAITALIGGNIYSRRIRVEFDNIAGSGNSNPRGCYAS